MRSSKNFTKKLRNLLPKFIDYINETENYDAEDGVKGDEGCFFLEGGSDEAILGAVVDFDFLAFTGVWV